MLTDDQKEALQEIANIGMGQAGSSIAKVLNEFVHLSIPRILILPPEALPTALARTVGNELVTVVRQAFHSHMRGEVIVIYGEHRCNDLADLMGYDHDLDHVAELELLLDVSNILVGAYVGGIAAQLRAPIGFSAPSLMADRTPIEKILHAANISWQNALLVEVNFQLEQRSFACHLIILMADEEIVAMTDAINRFLEGS